MKKAVLFLIVILAVVGIFILTRDTTNAPSDDTEVTDTQITPDGNLPPVTTGEDQNADGSTADEVMEEVTVAYGPNGFQPKSVEIKMGQVVTFVNESESSMWVASAKHPTHTDYPEKTDKDCLGSAFEQCVASGVGTSYSFTFNDKGSWNYHNHLMPSHWGTVVVK